MEQTRLKKRAKLLASIKLNASKCLEYGEETEAYVTLSTDARSYALNKWSNVDWKRAFEEFFLSEGCESFEDCWMQDDLLFFVPNYSEQERARNDSRNKDDEYGRNGDSKDVVFVRRWKKNLLSSTTMKDGHRSELTVQNVDWRASTLLNIVQHTTYEQEVSVCSIDKLVENSSTTTNNRRKSKINKNGDDDFDRGSLANPLAKANGKVYASTSKMAISNSLKSDRRESTLPEVAFESHESPEQWDLCALVKDSDCLCVRLFATGGVLRALETDEKKKRIVVFSGFAPRSDVARAYNVERKASYKQSFTFRALASSAFGFDIPKIGASNSLMMHNTTSNYDNNYNKCSNGAAAANEEKHHNDVAENGLFYDPYDSNNNNNNTSSNNNSSSANYNHHRTNGGGKTFSPHRHHPKSFASPSRGGAGETDAVVTLGQGTEDEGEAAVAVSAERINIKDSTNNRVAEDSGTTTITAERSTSSARVGAKKLLNFGLRKVEIVPEVSEIARDPSSSPSSSSLAAAADALTTTTPKTTNTNETAEITRLRCRLLSVKVHWRALARDLLYKEWRTIP